MNLAVLAAWLHDIGKFAQRAGGGHSKLEEEYCPFYDGLCKVIEAFGNWDIFNYKSAKNQLEQGLGKLRVYCNRAHENFRSLYGELQKSLEQLEKTEKEAALLQGKFKTLPPDCGDVYLRDLVANARRCAKRGHYDDAVARLYSVVEKSAKIALAQRGINNSDIPRDLLDQSCEELAAKYANAPSNRLQLPLTDSFKLFCSLHKDHPLAKTFSQHEQELANCLQSRNMSLLAHGYTPVRKEECQKLYLAALEFLSISEQELPAFPVLELNSIIF